MDQHEQLITRDFELTERIVGLINGIASKTQLNKSWVFATLIESGLKRADTRNKNSEDIFWTVSGRQSQSSLARIGVCISKELDDKIKLVARMCSFITYEGDIDMNEAAARLLVLALTDRECEFKDALDVDEVDGLYLINDHLGIKPQKGVQ